MKATKELEKHRFNIRQILQCSNATPIRCRGGIGYACCFCTSQFPDPADLKKHTLGFHDEKSRRYFMQGKMMFSYLVKLDITSLECKICDTTIDTIEQLIDHLINVHQKNMFTDIKNHIMPFKFTDELLRCVICSTVFNKFKALQEHMNTHYRNYVCDVCDAGFVNRNILLSHAEGHKTGTFNCDFCTKVYTSFRRKKSHEKSVHIYANMLNRCGYCNEKFKDYRLKEKHLSTVHGVQAMSLKCQACEKSFATKTALTVHTKRDHLMERRHECSVCDMKFFMPYELKEHMVKHTGVRKFECEVCHKAYGRRKTLREHMRIHVDDRRFKCDHCGLAFVQKCSWRGHVRSKHGSGRVDDKEQDVIILGDLTIEVKGDVPENDDVLLHIENDPLATEDQANESTRQNSIENIIETLEQSDVNSDDAKVEPNNVTDLNKLDTGQNQNNDQDFGQKIPDNIKNISCGPKDNNDADNSATEQKINETESCCCNLRKGDILRKIFQTRFRIEKNIEIKKAVAKHDINSKVSVENIIDTLRTRRKRYDLQLEVPNEDDIYEKGRSRLIRHRRHSVFEKAIPKTDSEGFDKVSKRRKSIDFGQMKNGDNRIGTKQSYNDEEDEDDYSVTNKLCDVCSRPPRPNEKGNRPIRQRTYSVLEKAIPRTDSEGNNEVSKRRKSIDCGQMKNSDNKIDTKQNYNDDDDGAEHEYSGTNKLCDVNFRLPRPNEKDRNRPIRQRRHSVFEKAIPKTDSEGTSKASKRRKSVDCGQMKNGDNKIGKKQNDNDEDHYTVPNKKFCDANFKVPRLNKKTITRPTKQRRHSVFEEAIPKTDSEDSNKVSKRRKSIDCGHMRNKDDEIGTRQNSKSKDHKQSTSKCQGNEKSVTEPSEVNETVNSANEKTTNVNASAKQDTNNVNKDETKLKYQDYDLFKGPLKTQRNFREEREAEFHLMKHREAVLNAIKNRRVVVNVVKIQDVELNRLQNREPEPNDMKNEETEREKSNASAPGNSILSDPLIESPSQNESKKSEESGTKDITIGNSDGGSKNSSPEKKVKKKVSFHPDIVTRSQHRKNIAKDESKHSNADDNPKKGSRENKGIDDHKSKNSRKTKQNKADNNQPKESREKTGVDPQSKSCRENKQNKADDIQEKGSREKRGTDYQRRSSRESKKNKTDDNQNKGSKENKQNKADDYQNQRSREKKKETDYQSKRSGENIQSKADDNTDKGTRDNKTLTDYQNKSSRENEQNKTDDNQNKGFEENQSIMYYRSQSHVDNISDINTNSHKRKLSENYTTSETVENLNSNTDKESELVKANDVPKSRPRRKLLDDLKIKDIQKKNKYNFNNEAPIQLQFMERDDTVKMPHRQTLIDDLKYKRFTDIVNEHDSKSVKEGSDVDVFTPPLPPRRKLLDDLKSKKEKEKTDVTKINAGHKDICGENISLRRGSFDDPKYKSKEKPHKDIFDDPIRAGGRSLEHMEFSNVLDSSKEKQRKDIFNDPFKSKKDGSHEYKRFSSNLLDDPKEDRSLNKEKDCTVDEALHQKRKDSDCNIFKDQGREEKSSKRSDHKVSKRVSIDNKDSGCELFDESKNQDAKKKKTDSDKQKKEGVDSKGSEDKPKKSQRIDNDKHKRDESNDKKCSDRKSSHGTKNKTFDEIEKNNSDNKGRVDHDLEGKKKDSVSSNVRKHDNVKDFKEAVKRRRSEVNTGDKNKRSSSHANSDIAPTSAKKAKTGKEKSIKSSSQSQFDDLLKDDTEQKSEEEIFRAKILEARALESEDEVDKPNKRLTASRRPQLEFHKHVVNIKTIMRWTNATPIRSFGGIGYECAFCETVFRKPGDLKTHTLVCHHRFSNAYFFKKADVTTFLVKLDITDLECYICAKKINNVKVAMNHLWFDHKKKIHEDVKDHVVPFKFDYNDANTLTCFMCTSRYTKFKILLEHTISTHCKNYTCKECNMGFVTTRKLQFHVKIHKKRPFKCGYCEETHDTLAKRTAHEMIHQVNTSQCTHCGESFFDDTKKLCHLVEVHGVGLPRIVCNACDRVFTTQADYATHMKRDHSLERNYECTECQLTFFKNAELKYHMLMHTDDGCHQMLMTKENPIQHMSNVDKGFACERCGRRFMTKSTWRKHMIEVHHENI